MKKGIYSKIEFIAQRNGHEDPRILYKLSPTVQKKKAVLPATRETQMGRQTIPTKAKIK